MKKIEITYMYNFCQQMATIEFVDKTVGKSFKIYRGN